MNKIVLAIGVVVAILLIWVCYSADDSDDDNQDDGSDDNDNFSFNLGFNA